MIRSIRPVLAAVFLLLATLAPADEPTWTWIHGQLPDADAQRTYMEFAVRIHTYYQDHGLMIGPMVAERDCDPWPDDHVAFIGPLEAFDDPARFGLPITMDGDVVRVGAQVVTGPRVGIYLMNEAETRVVYTGLSYEGFGDIFTVPTGSRRCTVTQGRGQVLYDTDDLTSTRDLHTLPFLHPYPSPEEVADLELPDGALELAPVTTTHDPAALDPTFADWLDGFVDGQRVLFFGESHWNQSVNRLFILMMDHLLDSSDLRAVFLETNYSFSAYFDHYISAPDEALARQLLKTRLHHMISSEGTLQLLQSLRRWNLAHPDRMVRVGCLDMEWNWPNVVMHVIRPYFKLLDPDFTLAPEADGIRRHVRELLDQARAQELVGEYSFLTPDYMAEVMTNFWDTHDIDSFNVDRQRGIIRNIAGFNGALLDHGLVMFKGGGSHAKKTKSDDDDFYRDAAWLHLEHPPTRGKVVTFMAQGLSYRFADIADVNLSTRKSSATNYNELARDFQAALKAGRAERDEHYLLSYQQLSNFDRLVIKQAYADDLNVVRVSGVDWDALDAVWGDELSPREARACDAAVYVLRADLELMRPLRFEE